MIAVDSSVWIDFFRGNATPAVQRFRQLLAEGVAQIIVPDLVLYEVLRGFRHEREFRQAKALMQALKIEPAMGENLALQAAEHYRHMCAAGYTVKSAIDILLGAFCLENGYTLLHQDRDFDMMHALRGLRVLTVTI